MPSSKKIPTLARSKRKLGYDHDPDYQFDRDLSNEMMYDLEEDEIEMKAKRQKRTITDDLKGVKVKTRRLGKERAEGLAKTTDEPAPISKITSVSTGGKSNNSKGDKKNVWKGDNQSLYSRATRATKVMKRFFVTTTEGGPEKQSLGSTESSMSTSLIPELVYKRPAVTEKSEGIALPPLRLAAFNIQIFGQKKMDQKQVTQTLIKILQRYDLILIQEIRDSSNTALDQLVSLCSAIDPDNPFTATVSERLGRSNCKEQYAFMYRSKRLIVRDTYQYDDGVDNGTDVFQREPFAVRFSSPSTELQDFAVIAIHTDPDDAVKEIGALHDVYETTRLHWGLEDILIAGDFNADEGYVDQDDWAKIALRNDRKFQWLIDDSTDTTVGNTDRAYDRFVVTGKNLINAVVPGSTKVFRFDEELGLSAKEAQAVSDHYPIELELVGKVNETLQEKLATSISFVVDQKQPIKDESNVKKMYRTPTGPKSANFRCQINYDKNRMKEVVAVRNGMTDVMKALEEFQSVFHGVLYNDTLTMVKAYLQAPIMTSRPYIYGLHTFGPSDNLDIKVTAQLQQPLLCSVRITQHIS